MKITYSNVAFMVSVLIGGAAVAQNISKAPYPVAPVKAESSAPTGDADLALLQTHCSACHTLDQVTARNKTADEWAETMDRMVDHGMQITPEDSKRITDYLIAHYGAK